MRFEAAADFISEREPGIYIQKPDFRVLGVLARICTRHEKLYCYPSLQTVRELVFRFTGRSISVRSLCRHMGALERDGWIRRIRRHRTGTGGELELHSTLYILKVRAVKWCRALGTNLWRFSVAAAKSLMDIAMPFVAETLAQESKSHYKRAAQAPPRR